MSKDIHIRKGLDIKLVGDAEKVLSKATTSNFFSIKPEDFHTVVPKLLVKKGDKILAGTPLFYDKTNEDVKFTSPVSGEILDVIRGERRRILEIRIKANKEQTYLDFGIQDPSNISVDKIKQQLMSSGCWAFIKQRPYDVIANPNTEPKAIFVSAYASAPLVADYDFCLKGKEKELQTAIDALAKLTKGNVHVSVGKNSNNPMSGLNGITLHKVSGPHPSGNVSTQIAQIDPISKGELVWVVTPQDLIIIGELFLTGKYNAERIVALVGSMVKKPQYLTTKIGAEIASVVYSVGTVKNEDIRIVSGSVLTGKSVKPDGFLTFYENVVTVLPEGNDYDFFGWNKPIFNKMSVSRALTFSWLFPNKKYDLNTNTNGEHRAFVLTGNYEKVFPLDIYPMQILKACMYADLDEMESLGMYEVAPEDFALTEFVCVSKQPHQEIIRKGLDLMIKEIG